MSELKVNSIKGVGASTAAITVNNSDGTCTANITNNLSNRNLLINGDFSVNQRGGTNTTINTYALDRWRSYGGPLGFTISQQNNISNGSLSSSKYAIRFQRTASNSQTNNTGIAQGVETLNCQGIAGTQVTLSFLARKGADMSDDLSYTIFFGQGTDESPVGMTSMTNSSSTSALTTSFVKYTKTVTVPANTSQITVGFTYDPTGTAGANDWFEIAECQLERGSVATDFEHPRSFGDELARCQRYFCKMKAYAGASNGWIIQYPVTMRSAPSATVNSGTIGSVNQITTSTSNWNLSGGSANMAECFYSAEL